MPTIDHYDAGTPCWVDLATTDPEAASRFYAQVFGWSDDPVDVPDAGVVYRYFRLHGRAVAGCAPLPAELADSGVPPVWQTYLAGQADDVAARVADAGGELMGEPTDVMEHGRVVMFRDPTGAVTGVWEARAFVGAELVNEPRTLTWNELNTPDLEASTRFLQQVFGVTTDEVDDAPSPYRTFSVAGEVRGGIQQMGSDADRFGPHWMTYFWVEDVDATSDTVRAAGGAVHQPAFDTPFGRMAVVADPQGAVFMITQPPAGTA